MFAFSLDGRRHETAGHPSEDQTQDEKRKTEFSRHHCSSFLEVILPVPIVVNSSKAFTPFLL
jgi:hypothetical protein